MKQRCCNPANASYSRYGGRGIEISPEWLGSFESFQAWALSAGYRSDLQLDRINNDGPYTPENCRWADRFTQMNNTRATRLILFRGEKKSITEWSREFGMSAQKLAHRLQLGMSMEDAIKPETLIGKYKRGGR